MNFNKRLESIEFKVALIGDRNQAYESANELLAEFRRDPQNEAVYRNVTGPYDRNLLDLIRERKLCIEIGNFCRKHRLKFPGAKHIHLRWGTNIVFYHPEGKLLHLFAEITMPDVT